MAKAIYEKSYWNLADDKEFGPWQVVDRTDDVAYEVQIRPEEFEPGGLRLPYTHMVIVDDAELGAVLGSRSWSGADWDWRAEHIYTGEYRALYGNRRLAQLALIWYWEYLLLPEFDLRASEARTLWSLELRPWETTEREGQKTLPIDLIEVPPVVA